MNLTLQITIAFGLDLLLGDPRNYPHPVKLIGASAKLLEGVARRNISSLRLAGCIVWLGVVAGTGLTVWSILSLAGALNQILADCLSVFFIYTALSARGLFDESLPVLRCLQSNNETGARNFLSRIVGRDTENLDSQGIKKATIETIAENMVDGVAAPLFYACIGGAPLALAYKAVNTLDSMFGYRNDTYQEFGWASARLDDAANWVPSRIAGYVILPLAAGLCGLNAYGSVKTVFRDGQNHASPNAGIPEAAVAGALDVQLGGPAFYDGQYFDKPAIGYPSREIALEDISKSHRILFASSVLATALAAFSEILSDLF